MCERIITIACDFFLANPPGAPSPPLSVCVYLCMNKVRYGYVMYVIYASS